MPETLTTQTSTVPTDTSEHISNQAPNVRDVFQELYELDIAPHIQHIPSGNREIDYIEWATAWKLARLHSPNLSYEVRFFKEKDSNQEVPYLKTGIGYFVVVSVTIEGRSELEVYALDVKDPTPEDVAIAHQRALVKCLGRHGLGLKLWEKAEREKLSKRNEPTSRFASPKSISPVPPQPKAPPPGSSHPTGGVEHKTLPSEGAAGEFVITFGKPGIKGKKLSQLSDAEIRETIQYWNSKKGNYQPGDEYRRNIEELERAANAYFIAKKAMGVS